MSAKREIDDLLAELEHARAAFQAAERRVRTDLVARGVRDQATRSLSSLLRDADEEEDQRAAARASSSS
jgi:hypothetical protein